MSSAKKGWILGVSRNKQHWCAQATAPGGLALNMEHQRSANRRPPIFDSGATHVYINEHDGADMYCLSDSKRTATTASGEAMDVTMKGKWGNIPNCLRLPPTASNRLRLAKHQNQAKSKTECTKSDKFH